LDLSQIVGNSFEYAKKLFSDLGRLAILIVLDIIPIVNLIVLGYMTRVIKETPGSLEPPPLRDYGDMFIQGLKVAIAAFLYMLIPLILIMIGVGSFIFGAFGMGMFYPAFGALGIGLLAVGVILAFAIAIIMAMAIVHIVKNNRFGKAFAVGEILGIIGKIGWGKYILWLIVMFIIAVVVGALGSIPLIGWLISLIIAPIFSVFFGRSAALIYSEAVPPVGVPPAPPAPPTYAPPPPPPPVGFPSVKFCVHCGAQIAAEAVFCPKCGGRQ
jgi:hypothetical protein